MPVARNHINTLHRARRLQLSKISENGSVCVKDEDPDDVGLDQAPNLSLAFRKVVIKTRVLDGDRRLRGEEFQHRDPRWREGPRREVVLEVEHADELGLVDQGQAKNGMRLALTDVRVSSKRGLGRCIVENDVFPGA